MTTNQRAPFRVLVTGSRSWTDESVVEEAIVWWCGDRADVVVVHGDCPSGADRIAKDTAIALNIPHEPHRPDWQRGIFAGFERNDRMVAAGADVCLAFADVCRKRGCRRSPQPHTSHGTAHCMSQAHKAGIPVEVFGFGARSAEESGLTVVRYIQGEDT